MRFIVFLLSNWQVFAEAPEIGPEKMTSSSAAKKGRITEAYEVQAFPVGLLVGVDGKGIGEGVPGTKNQELEKVGKK